MQIDEQTDSDAQQTATSSENDIQPNAQIPVLVLSGFLGSGKTTLLKHILAHKNIVAQRAGKKDVKIALIVNDMAEINVDGREISDLLVKTEEKLIEIQNGCICCTLREDLLQAVEEISKSKAYDYIIIESSGVSEPLPVAATFTFDLEDGRSLRELAKIDAMATVLDATQFIDNYYSVESLKDRKQAVNETDERAIIDLIIDQIEFANIIILNKIELIEPEQLQKTRAIIRSLNAKAKLIETSHAKVDVAELLHTDLFNYDEAATFPTWINELQNSSVEHTPETEEYGISSFIYRARMPFHPQRLWDFFHTKHPEILRAKGHFWLASRNDYVGMFQLAGRLKEYSLAGTWWASEPKESWPENLAEILKPVWNERFGDRRQEIVFIGTALDVPKLTEELDACLVSEAELAEQKFEDPFPKWTAPKVNDEAYEHLADVVTVHDDCDEENQ
jgi:G3E family GTPase